jgi:folate-binding protein YgfZ
LREKPLAVRRDGKKRNGAVADETHATIAEALSATNLNVMSSLTYLPDRGVLEIAGPDRINFLQGLVSNDVTAVKPGALVWAAFLTPQGKWLADFFIGTDGERLLLDAERAQIPLLLQKLGRYRLRAQVALRDASEEWAVHAAWGGTPDAPEGVRIAADPRLDEAGWRLYARAPLPGSTSFEAWDRHRLALGLPDGSRDLEAEKTVLLEAGFDELNGISWSKGCYLGQELTARTKYRGLVKRRLVPVLVTGELPEPGTPVMAEEKQVGEMRSGQPGIGLALLRIEAFGQALRCGPAELRTAVPRWMRLAAAQA